MKIAKKLSFMVIGLMLVMNLIVASIGYQSTYSQVKESAGLELIGCANITTALVSPEQVEALVKGDTSQLSLIEKNINWIVDHKRIFKNASIMTPSGKLLAVDQQLQNEGFKSGDSFPVDAEKMKELQNKKHSIYSDIYHYGNGQRLTGYAPIFKDNDPTKEVLAMMAIDFDASIISQRMIDVLWAPYLAGVLISMVMAVVIYLFIGKMMAPIQKISEQVGLISSGNLKVSPLEFKSKDEIGQLTKDLNEMVGNLESLIKDINATANQVASASEELNASAEQCSAASVEITNVFLAVSEGAEKQSKQVNKGTEVVANMAKSVQSISNLVDQMTVASQDTLNQATLGNQAVKETVNRMDKVSQTIDQLSIEIQTLESRSMEINSIVEMISAIAQQTNLLALNAAIESARAGEHGRGFAVVAQEVRKLAEQSTRSTEKIASLITLIQTDTHNVVQQMDVAINEVHEGSKGVHAAGMAFQDIHSSIVKETEQLGEAAKAAKQVKGNICTVVQAIQEIREVAAETSSGSEMVSASSQEQLAAMEEISDSAHYLAKSAEELLHKVERFKV